MRLAGVLTELIQDVHYGIRMLIKNPGFTIVAAIGLALGIGVNTAMFSLVNSILLRELPARDAGHLVVLAGKNKNTPQYLDFSYPDFLDYQAQSSSAFSDMLAFSTDTSGLSMDGHPQEVVTCYVSENFFSMLGVGRQLGRLIEPRMGAASDAPNPVIVLSDSYWRRIFSADPSVIGKTVLLNGSPVTIIGVAMESFQGPNAFVNADVYTPLSQMVQEQKCACATRRGPGSLRVIGLLRPNMNRTQARAVVNVVAQRLATQFPDTNKGLAYELIPEPLARPQPDAAAYWPIVLMLSMGLAAVVLVLACANVANLLLVRASAREAEMAVRSALGAGRGRLVRQLLTENMVLALLGGSLGLLLGMGVSKLLSSMARPIDFPMFHIDLVFDWHVFLFAFAISLLVGLIMGLVSARPAWRSDLTLPLHEGHTVTHGRAGSRQRYILVGLQMATSTILLIVAGLFFRSLSSAQHTDLGFDSNNVLNYTMDIQEAGYTQQQGEEFYAQLLDKVQALPSVESAAYARSVPFGGSFSSSQVLVEGQVLPPNTRPPVAIQNPVSPDYFRTMRIALLRGRAFKESDDAKALPVAIINQAMAQRFWPQQDPMGKRFKRSETAPWNEVVGVAKNVNYLNPATALRPYFYIPIAQNYVARRTLQIRTAMSPEVTGKEIFDLLHSLAPNLPVASALPMKRQLQGLNGFYLFQVNANSAGMLGILGLFLAIIGVYGVVSFAANQRTHEVGLRMALGAQRPTILKMFVRQGLVMVVIGAFSGILISLPLARLISHLSPYVTATDPLIFGTTLAVVAGVALVACYLPARRVTRLDPMVVLRHE